MTLLPKRPTTWSEPAVWQDVEFGAYAADMALWSELANASGGKVVELGAGSGRVGLALAQDGHEVVAIDNDAELIGALGERAEGLPLTAVTGDAARLDDIAEAAGASLVIGPLQVAQLLDAGQRAAMLAGAAACLAPGGRCAFALVDEDTLIDRSDFQGDPRPDMREIEGWVYSSEPLWVQVTDETLRMRRLRQRVAPDGDLVRKVHDDVLFRLPPEQAEREGEAAGLRPAGRRTVASSEYEAGSVVVVMEAP